MTYGASEQGPARRGERSRRHPPYDPELAPLVGAGAVDGHPLRAEDVWRLRALNAMWRPSEVDLSQGGAVCAEQRVVPGRREAPSIPVLILWPTAAWTGPRPVVLACHGGGMVTGDAFSGSPGLARWVAQLGIVAISPDYRLSPENPYPAALDDAMTVLAWLHDQAGPLGIDPARLGVFGISAGACLAAAASLRARDEGVPGPAFQILQDAMLDDRAHRPSAYEHPEGGAWDRASNTTAWHAYLGEAAGGAEVSVYAAPGRAADDHELLAGLPPTYLDVGSADLFRDDVMAYGSALLQAGVPTELHVWPGGWHGFAEMAADTRLGRLANETRTSYLARAIGR